MGFWLSVEFNRDDATSEIYGAFFVEEGGNLSSFRGLQEFIEGKGLFSSLYADRGLHYWFTEALGSASTRLS